jgi:enoyl-CoA hydratase/long-chain 3-hydroxyacyl-CoA dehydrogenase
MHYFSPVNKMPLLEIIRHAGTSDDTTSAAFAMGMRQGKVPIIVKDVPGFFVNRCLGPYSDEGLAVLLDGASPKDIDDVGHTHVTHTHIAPPYTYPTLSCRHS